ncbi:MULTISPECIES: glycosyltransferase family 2 protein [Microbacterium]|uniref:glycosyltransferase n=1 Tax=Microbacterium TaxID=33882 RepID=UPI002783B4F7|nr:MULTISPECIES: glycosyltransferase family 2 protein [Microbacterium]MDQ1085264.1 glycosyltransferase involved in cell wall biosynthesis [Microbacterium sp. SORGH_AS_0344]MDQ1169429.1 glycosyltransferase involved in cell wall biosynthesis [Microbacterium proteolyticum]
MRAVAVVIPAHDEEALIGRCLASVGRAVAAAQQRHPDLVATVVVVLDACSDTTAPQARRWPVHRIEIEARNVGTARRTGVAHALSLLDASPHDTWIAMTDADTVVPRDWLTHQLDLADAGVDLVLGTVRPDFADLSARHASYWRATHHRGRPPGNVHGANLGVRASTYAEAGGIPDLVEHEDVALVRAVRALGARERASDVHEVETSGRLVGRTPAGYAAFLARVHAWIDAPPLAAPGA